MKGARGDGVGDSGQGRVKVGDEVGVRVERAVYPGDYSWEITGDWRAYFDGAGESIGEGAKVFDAVGQGGAVIYRYSAHTSPTGVDFEGGCSIEGVAGDVWKVTQAGGLVFGENDHVGVLVADGAEGGGGRGLDFGGEGTTNVSTDDRERAAVGWVRLNEIIIGG